jgi:hypothetical protein
LFFSRPPESALDRLRKQDPLLEDLPDTIELPPLGPRRTTVTKPLPEATLDDVALAILGLHAQVRKVEVRLYALKHLHDRARAKGALGATRIADLPPLPSRYS